MAIPSEKELLNAAVHFGHRKEKWNPKMAPYLYGTRKGIHIFELTKTKEHLERVCNSLKKLQVEGKTILFVSTKQQSIPLIEHLAQVLNQPMVTKKWIPGLLTNWSTIKRRLKYYLELQRSFQTGEIEKYTKKEQMALRKKLAKLDTALAGVSRMTGLPDAVFVLDAIRDHVAVLEAAKLKIPLFGVCDSNSDPDDFTEFIPANDDAIKSIVLILDTIEAELAEAKAKHEESLEKKHVTPDLALAAEMRQKQE
jgi:small subunit ribosomal protein S2